VVEEGEEAGDSFGDLQLVATDDGVLGTGTYGEVRLGVCQGRRVAVKSYSHGSSTVPQVPHHPGLVTVISRRVENGRAVEIRELCGQGELFDVVAEGGGMGESENVAAAAEKWVGKIAETVAHCHSHGVANGQLRPEHVLLVDVDPKLLGFASCLPPPLAAGGAPLLEGHQLLRPVRALDAPELHGQQSASFPARAAADVWALGVLIVFIFSAEPPFLSSAPGGYDPPDTLALWRGRGHGHEQPSP
jgi:serine/threonine protein kinase